MEVSNYVYMDGITHDCILEVDTIKWDKYTLLLAAFKIRRTPRGQFELRVGQCALCRCFYKKQMLAASTTEEESQGPTPHPDSPKHIAPSPWHTSRW